MSGSIARTGFLFQDLYLLARMLRTASNSLDLAWRTSAPEVVESLKDLQVRFGLEASGSAEELHWDVLVLTGNKLEFAEVKSGLVSKEHRIAFWRRLRRELTSEDKGTMQLVPVLVVDPEKAESLTKWNELATYRCFFHCEGASARVHRQCFHVRGLAWRSTLVSLSAGQNERFETTRLRREHCANRLDFELHPHVSDQLDSEVAQLLELLFPNGLTETQKTLLLGWLNQRATSKN